MLKKEENTMKRLRFFPLSVLLVLVVAFPAFGATLDYSLKSESITVEAGSSWEMPFTVSIATCSSFVYDVSFADNIEGNLPSEWVTVSPSSAFMLCWGRGRVASMLKITVPDNAGGDYSGYLFSRARGAHGLADPGDGIYINVHVPSSCNSAPTVNVDPVKQTTLWPPNGRMEYVKVTGQIILPSGCTITDAGYSIDDSYDLLDGMGSITLRDDNSFTAEVPLEVSRRGNDKDGRSYKITVFAADEVDVGYSLSEEVVVPHDKGKK
jgi:hypothetical protein